MVRIPVTRFSACPHRVHAILGMQSSHSVLEVISSSWYLIFCVSDHPSLRPSTLKEDTTPRKKTQSFFSPRSHLCLIALRCSMNTPIQLTQSHFRLMAQNSPRQAETTWEVPANILEFLQRGEAIASHGMPHATRPSWDRNRPQ